MKLRINGFENEIVFGDDNVSILQIEEAKCFTHIIDVINQNINRYENNEIILLDEEDREIKIDKNMYIALDLFNIDYNSKKIINKMYDIIAENIQNSQEVELEKITIKLRNYLIQEINELPFEFVMKSEISIQETLKIFDVKIDSINYSSILERLELLVNLISTLNIAKVLVIPNLKMYLSECEIIEFYKYSLYNNVKLLIIERYTKKKLEYEKIMRIDEDFNDEII